MIFLVFAKSFPSNPNQYYLQIVLPQPVITSFNEWFCRIFTTLHKIFPTKQQHQNAAEFVLNFSVSPIPHSVQIIGPKCANLAARHNIYKSVCNCKKFTSYVNIHKCDCFHKLTSTASS